MSIFDNSRSVDLQAFRIDSIRPVSVKWEAKDAGGRRDDTADRNKEWEVRLTLAQNYWANDVQREHMERIAIRCLAAKLYEDVLSELPHLRVCIESGDKYGAMRAVDRIESATRP